MLCGVLILLHLICAGTAAEKSVFVSYAYHDWKRAAAGSNLEFFLKHGVSRPSPESDLLVEYGLVINGHCNRTVCTVPESFVRQDSKEMLLNVIRRRNVGYDFGAHTVMLDSLNRTYDSYIFLNDGVAGPVYPAYMPPSWHWTEAFTSKQINGVELVGTSLFCKVGEYFKGKIGPVIETFAFSLTRKALVMLRKESKVFSQHPTKKAVCNHGENAMTRIILEHNMSIDTLLHAYQGVDWTNPSNWNCNEGSWPSRAGSYFGVSIHPFEVIFHKVYWAKQPSVLEQYQQRYMRWADNRLEAAGHVPAVDK